MNVVGLFVLFLGYFLTTGTEFLPADEAKNNFRALAAALFVANMLIERVFKIHYILVLLFSLLVLSVSRSEIGFNIVFLMLVVASLSSLDAREAAIAVLFPTLVVVSLHILMMASGLISEQMTSFGGRMRSTLGFTNPNQAASVYLSMAFLASHVHALYARRVTLLLCVGCYTLAFLAFNSTDSRTAFASLAALAISQFASALFLKRILYRRVLVLSAYAAPIVCIWATYFLISSKDFDLNQLLSLRPYLFARFVADVTVTEFLFGWPVVDGAEVDSMYLTLLSGVGAFGMVFILCWYYYALRRLDLKSAAPIIILLFTSIFEGFLLRPEIPISALFILLLLQWRRHRQSFDNSVIRNRFAKGPT